MPVASMAFTPTSVIRKIAQNKVDEKMNEGQQLTQLLQTAGKQQGMTAAHNSLLQQQANQQQLLAAANSMRPIVKRMPYC